MPSPIRDPAQSRRDLGRHHHRNPDGRAVACPLGRRIAPWLAWRSAGWRLLSRAKQAGINLDAHPADAERLADVVAEAVPYLNTACERSRPEEPAKLNLLLTDGHVLVATRWRL